MLEALSVGRAVLGWDHGGVGELLHRFDPRGAVQPFDGTLLERTALALLDAPPPRPVTMPHTLRAMQEATLAVYAELERD